MVAHLDLPAGGGLPADAAHGPRDHVRVVLVRPHAATRGQWYVGSK